MNLKEMDFERQVKYLRSLLSSGKSNLVGYFALFAMRHHLAIKHSPSFNRKPVIRWYLGQLAKEYISRYFNQAKESLENFTGIGLLEAKDSDSGQEFYLSEELYPALKEVLEEIFGKEYISKTISRAKYYRNPRSKKTGKPDENSPEVKK